jgi:5-methyltetrahydrofolate--homocysteine methyltransferase
MDFLELAREKVIIFDGAMGTQIQARDLGPDDFWGLEGFNEILNLSRPDVIQEIHAAYFDAGADAVETNTFGAHAVVASEYGAEDRVHELNYRAAVLAKEVASSYSDKPRFVTGSVGPGTKLPSLGQVDFAYLERAYTEQITALVEGGVDAVHIETCQDLLQTKAAIAGAFAAFERTKRRLPVIVQVTIETTGTMLLGTEIAAAIAALEPYDIHFIGINCATGPREMVEHIRTLSEQSPKMISVLPNAGLPELSDQGPRYPLEPEEFVSYHEMFVEEFGVNAVGGCCGTTPEFISLLADRLGNASPKPRDPVYEPSLSSLYSAVPIRQQTSFLIVGERANANGSKAFREALLAGDWESCVDIATAQVKEGAHVIDVCVDYVGRDGVSDMTELASRLATRSTLPLVLDSTEPAVIEAGLSKLGGRSVINSINLEDGETKMAILCPLAKKFGAACIALLIDEEGQARTVDWKMRVAHRIYELATEKYGLRPQDLIFDALTFPLGSGQEDLRKDGIYTLEAIRRIKEELPGSYTILGISNCSFGLSPKARPVLNSVFLHEAVEAGLDAAIVHAGKILPLSKIPERQVEVAKDLIYDRRKPGYDPLQVFIELFEEESDAGQAESDLADLEVEERLKQRIVDGNRKGLEADLDEALQKYSALDIVNNILLEGMKIVGDLFASGQMQLPFVLQSAECMKHAVAYLEPHMEKVEGQKKGKVVLATVKGDVHDIGKNLVDIILSNNGYEIINLGIKVPISDMIEAMQKHDADVLGMSGLLVKSTQVMKENLEELNRRGLYHWPVILGGAALTRSYVESDLRKIYKGRLFYGKDAFEGLRTVERLVEGLRKGDLPDDFGRIPTERSSKMRDIVIHGTGGPETKERVRSDVAIDVDVPIPPYLGSRITKGLSLDEIALYLNKTALYRNQWQLRKGVASDEEYERLVESEAEPALRAWLDRSKREQLLVPQVVHGYWPAQSEGNDLIVYRPRPEILDAIRSGEKRSRSSRLKVDPSLLEELTRFEFPRQPSGRRLCLADFLRPVESGEIDFVGFFIVTMGPRASEKARELFEAGEYRDYLYLHGLSVEMTEALAEYWHKRMREEWGIAEEDASDLAGIFKQGYRGSRYSFGYPACPNLEDQAKLVELLQPGRIGVELSEEYQLQPEQSVSAVVVHHPEAKYFIIR